MSHSAIIRPVAEHDISAITDIYRHHVLYGLASFEEVPASEDDMLNRMTTMRDGGYPYMVADLDGVVVGYCYAGPYRARPGYRNTVENSVYLRPEAHGQGIAKALLQSVIQLSTDMGFRQMIAVIGDTDNVASIGLHTALGFRMVGTLKGVGFKLGHWVDSVQMQRTLGEGEETLPEC